MSSLLTTNVAVSRFPTKPTKNREQLEWSQHESAINVSRKGGKQTIAVKCIPHKVTLKSDNLIKSPAGLQSLKLNHGNIHKSNLHGTVRQ